MSERLLKHFDLLAQAPDGVARLRELILTLAVQGKLVPQDPNDEPASVLLQRIRAEKDRLIAEGAIKADKLLPPIDEDEFPFALPESWCWTPMGSVIDIVRGITFPASEKTKEPAQGRIACLRTANVQQAIEWDDLLFVNRSFMAREDQLLKHHDIVMSMANSRELVGKVALVENIPQSEATFGGFLGVLRPHQIEPQFVMVVLRTTYARAMLIDSSSQTTNIANVSLGKLRPLPFPLPPAAEQARIVTRVEELMRLCDALEAKQQLDTTQHAQLVQTLLGTLTDSTTPDELASAWQRVATHFDLLLDRPEAVDALEQTILQLAVRGLLVPQDPTDEPASVLLQRIRAEKNRLIAEGKIKRDKPLPPVTDEEITFELPKGWEWARLSNATIKITDGEHLSPPKSDYGMPLLTAKDVTNQGVNLVGTQFVSIENGSTYRIRCNPERGDILVCSRGTIGRCSAVETDQIFCLMGSVILLKSTAHISYKYLLIHLKTDLAQNWMKGISSATAVSALYLKDVARCLVPVPPLAEQSRIVTRVKELQELCNVLRQRLTASRTTQAHLAEALVESAGTA